MAEVESPRDAVTANPGEPRYKIGDVCRIADVQPYVLRYWESEFPALAPDRAASGPRTYSVKELRIIEQIKRLLYDEGYTIAGAKKRLETEALAAVRADLASAASEAARDDKPKAKAAAKAPAPKSAETAPVAAIGAGDSTAPVAVARASPGAPRDPRLPRAVAELKEILKILSGRP